jgi:hypothetical protein
VKLCDERAFWSGKGQEAFYQEGKMTDEPRIPTDTLAETENYLIWVSQEPDGETVFHIDLGPVTLHFFQDEWQEFVKVIREAARA